MTIRRIGLLSGRRCRRYDLVMLILLFLFFLFFHCPFFRCHEERAMLTSVMIDASRGEPA